MRVVNGSFLLSLAWLATCDGLVENKGNEGKDVPRVRKLGLKPSTWESTDLTKCIDEPYKLSLFVDKHIYLVATTEGTAANCKRPIVMEDGGGRVDIYIYQGHSNKLADGFWKDTVAVGSAITLKKIQAAVQNATLMEGDYTAWDIVNNNCAIFIESVLKQLKIEVPARGPISKYVVDRLAGQVKIIDTLRNSSSVGDILPTGTAVDDFGDKELVRILVGNFLSTNSA